MIQFTRKNRRTIQPVALHLTRAVMCVLVLTTLPSPAAIESIKPGVKNLVISGFSKNGDTLREATIPEGGYPNVFTAKISAGRFMVEVEREAAGRDRIYSGFVLEKETTNGAPVVRFAENLEQISHDRTPFPVTTTKKGLQVQMTDDALELGIQHAGLNVNLSEMINLSPQTNDPSILLGGGEFFFKPRFLTSLDSQVLQLSSRGVVVSLILLAYRSATPEINAIMFHPDCATNSPNNLTAFNTRTVSGVQWYQAAIEFLARRYSGLEKNQGQAMNYIVGNEVNSHWFWYNMGRVTMDQFLPDYATAVRLTHTAVRKHSASARVYLSLEHHWNIRYPGGDEKQAFPARSFVEAFARKVRREGDFDWHLAFHPYPENLFEPKTWLDKSATNSFDTPRITFKNLDVLPQFMAQPEYLHHGQPRRIILSEQGFHSRDTKESEMEQAAAFCYAYQRIKFLPTVDSFIYHRHVDHAHEGGLNLGLWTRQTNSVATPWYRKKIYQVFKAADTPGWEKEFEFALPVIGITNWTQLQAPADEQAPGATKE